MLISPLNNSRFLTASVCLNREPIADQLRHMVLQSRMLKYKCLFIILRLASAIGSLYSPIDIIFQIIFRGFHIEFRGRYTLCEHRGGT